MAYRQKKSIWWFFLVGAVIVILLLVIGNFVEAQGVVDADPVAPRTQDWIGFAQQIILLLVTGVLIPWLGIKLTSMQVETKHTKQIQTTAANAAALLLDPSLSWEQKKRRALDYMVTGAGDAMDYFKADPERTFAIVLSYYAKLKNAAGDEDPLKHASMEVDDILRASRRRTAGRRKADEPLASAPRRRPPPE